MKNYFPDYEGGADYAAACDYILNRFVSLNQHETKQIYTHFTCATDTMQIRFVMAAVNGKFTALNLFTKHFTNTSFRYHHPREPQIGRSHLSAKRPFNRKDAFVSLFNPSLARVQESTVLTLCFRTSFRYPGNSHLATENPKTVTCLHLPRQALI
jgi:hypothetical protein